MLVLRAESVDGLFAVQIAANIGHAQKVAMAAVGKDGVLATLRDVRKYNVPAAQAFQFIEFAADIDVVELELRYLRADRGLFVQISIGNAELALCLPLPVEGQVGVEQNEALDAAARGQFHAPGRATGRRMGQRRGVWPIRPARTAPWSSRGDP